MNCQDIYLKSICDICNLYFLLFKKNDNIILVLILNLKWENFIHRLIIIICFSIGTCLAHIPSLLLPLKGTPISSYFLGQADVSRAVFSELTQVDDFIVLHFNVKDNEKTLIQLFTPYCDLIPRYEQFQPTAYLIKGDLPWKYQSESNQDFINRLGNISIAKVESSYLAGKRPKFYEDYSKLTYWVGGEWRGLLKNGLYAIVVFDAHKDRGNIVLAMNEKETWTPDLFKYAAEVMPVIAKGYCDPLGYTGNLPGGK